MPAEGGIVIGVFHATPPYTSVLDNFRYAKANNRAKSREAVENGEIYVNTTID